MVILVTDGEHRAALAVVRSLGQAGHRVIVGSAHPRPIAAASRWSGGGIRLPDPSASPDLYRTAVGRAIDTTGAELVLPITEPSMLTLAGAGTGEPYRMSRIFPARAVPLRRALDKAEVWAAGRRVGLRVPAQAILRTPGDPLPADLPFPLVVKPSRSVTRGPRGWSTFGAAPASDPERLRAVLATYPPHAYPLLLQERIPGSGFGVFLLRWRNRPIAAFAHQRIRERPPWGGVSTCSAPVAADPLLIVRSLRLLERLGWEGVAMVEFKGGSGAEDAVLMEVNPRFWGSLQLAIDSGVDFPRILVDCIAGAAPPEPVLRWRLDGRLRWLRGEVEHALLRIREERPAHGERRNGKTLLRGLLPLLRWSPGDRAELLRLSDPLPFFADLVPSNSR